ncbi:MAG: macro domain-containing protein [Planctomycetota bacterium]
MSQMKLHLGDITELDVDAVVNAANESLLGGGGVDGAIHRAAGPELVEASRKLAPCPASEARLTRGFNLKAAYVIHAVGPVYRKADSGVQEALRNTYISALRIAKQENIASIAFPCISTGAYGYPQEEAAETAMETVCDWLQQNSKPDVVTFCCFERSDLIIYQRLFETIGIPTGIEE